MAARVEIDAGEFVQWLSRVADAAEANGFDVVEWAEGWNRLERSVEELVRAANGEPSIKVFREGS